MSSHREREILSRMRNRPSSPSTSSGGNSGESPIYYQGRDPKPTQYPIEMAMDNLIPYHIIGLVLSSGFGLAPLLSYMSMLGVYGSVRIGIAQYRKYHESSAKRFILREKK